MSILIARLTRTLHADVYVIICPNFLTDKGVYQYVYIVCTLFYSTHVCNCAIHESGGGQCSALVREYVGI